MFTHNLLICSNGLVREVVINTIVVHYAILENLNKRRSSMCVGTLEDIREVLLLGVNASCDETRTASEGVFSCRQRSINGSKRC